jgi:hypothetical protein
MIKTLKSNFKFRSNNILNFVVVFYKEMQIKKIYKETGYAHERKLYMKCTKIDFMAFATCYMMIKRKL